MSEVIRVPDEFYEKVCNENRENERMSETVGRLFLDKNQETYLTETETKDLIEKIVEKKINQLRR